MDKLHRAEEVISILEEKNPNAVLLEPRDQFNSALIGVAPADEDRWKERENEDIVAVYSEEKCVEALMDHAGMDYEMAQEYYDFNIEGSFMGTGTPIFVSTFDAPPFERIEG